jgi:phospholipid transport system substrate-binding protein
MPKPFFQGLLIFSLLTGLSAAVAGEEGDPIAMLRAMTEQLMEIAGRRPEILDDPVELRIVANEVVLPHVDFTMLSRWVLGKHWRGATAAQREAFISEFRELLLGTYLRSVSAYKDNTIQFLPLREGIEGMQGNQVVVHALVERKNGPVAHAAFRLHRMGGEWLIFDVIVEGISLVTTHRSTFSREIHNYGIDKLIERLRLKNESNAGQQVAGAG